MNFFDEFFDDLTNFLTNFFDEFFNIFLTKLFWTYNHGFRIRVPMIPRTAGANFAVKIQVGYFGVEMCLNHFEDFIIIEASSNVCHAMDNLTHRYCERVLNSVRDQTKDSIICGT